jgi:3-carboxy-cis,cis-muconate cycloisomerase
MRPMNMPARTIGDHQAEYVVLLGMLAATCGKIGREIYTLMKQEFGEVEEPVPPGTVGSSTMPQKRNPKLSQDVIAAAAQIRALVPLALDAMHTEHEADRTTSIMMTRAITQSCELTGDMLERLVVLFGGLQVFPARMRENLDLSGGLIMAEALMLELGKQIGRQRAHDAVYDAAQGSVTQSRPFREMLAEEPHVSARLTQSQVDALLDPARYTGLCRQFAERGAASARKVAATLERRAS